MARSERFGGRRDFFLASDASAYLTGQEIYVNGG
jgi:NAD(P)-dependent dehydrogenase (short-subunit alcohol dehydrogenase family)